MCLSTVGHLRGLWSGSYPRIIAAKNFFFANDWDDWSYCIFS